MSQPKGSVGVALGITALIIISVTSVGYYQFVHCAQNSCSPSSSESSTSAGASCLPPSCITIEIVVGAALLTNTAYSPDVARLVVGVNNTFQFINNDSQSGGVYHSATADSCPKVCPFDTGIIAYNVTSGPFTITTPGTYPYYCEVHPTTMVGSIVVVAGPGGSSSSATSTVASQGSSSSSSPPPGAQISILKGASSNTASPGYQPDVATVVVGVNNTISWTNNDAAAHTVTFTSVPSGAAKPDSGLISPGSFYSVTLAVPGTYQYVCSLHSWMKGTIIVRSG
jgi:plastocyanin